jgi:hypothetical protein
MAARQSRDQGGRSVAGARGEAGESRGGAEEDEGEKRPGTDLQNLESSGICL